MTLKLTRAAFQRNNVSAARTKGLEEDLGLQGREYDTLLSILYVGCESCSY